jgi:hypothetical protein
VYSVPAGTVATPNSIIASEQFNNFTADQSAINNELRPISVGGTAAATVAAALVNFGIDHLATMPTVTAADALDTEDRQWVFVAAANDTIVGGPDAGDGIVFTGYTADFRVQHYYPVSGTAAPWRRAYTAAAWTDWLQDISLTTHVTNGKATRFRDGLQICRLNKLTLTEASATHCLGTWTLPAAFVNDDYSVSVTLRPATDGGTVTDFANNATPQETAIGAVAVSKSTTAVTVAYYRSGVLDFDDGDELYVDLVATGEWF